MNSTTQNSPDLELERSLKENEHTLIVMDPKEFVDFIILQRLRSGVSKEGVSEWMNSVIMGSKKISSTTK
ncbi:hypothetical protein GCM10008940_30510 [Microbulbifer agarilyticus]